MVTVELRTVSPSDAEPIASLMHDALPIPERLWKIIDDPQCTTYAAVQDGVDVAGAIVRWGEESEIEVLAVDRMRRGHGIGKAVVACLLDEARRRNVHTVLVGTSSVGLDNIMFYQKCGFRMRCVRRSYFDEMFPELPMEWRGVRLHDMIVFDYIL
jgi:GNAT superfamily N-acetyltransferase